MTKLTIVIGGRDLWMVSHNAWCYDIGLQVCLQWIGRVADLSNHHAWGKVEQVSGTYRTGFKCPQPCTKLAQRTLLMQLQEVHRPCMLPVRLKSSLIYLHLISIVCMQLFDHACVKYLLLVLLLEHHLKLRCKLPHLVL